MPWMDLILLKLYIMLKMLDVSLLWHKSWGPLLPSFPSGFKIFTWNLSSPVLTIGITTLLSRSHLATMSVLNSCDKRLFCSMSSGCVVRNWNICFHSVVIWQSRIGTNLDLRTFAHNRSSNARKFNNHVQRLQMFTLIIMMPLQFELSQSNSKSWHVRQKCQLALTLVTTEIMIGQKC